MNKSTQPAPGSFDTIKGGAEKSIHMGAITEGYTLDAMAACALLNQALATEWLCVLRYRSHAIRAKGINHLEIAEEFAEHARNEEDHAEMIAERINQLGGDPVLDPAVMARESATSYGDATELTDMIRDDLVAERTVIELYRNMIQWFGSYDPTTRRMLESILADEEEHASELADLLAISSPRSLMAGAPEGKAAS
jgi:bacterioferritin